MTNLVRLLAVAVMLTFAACGNLPRGAALQREITRDINEDSASFQLVPVTRANAARIANWPVTGWSGSFHWIKTSRGPRSQVLRAGDSVSLKIWDNQLNSLLTENGSNVATVEGLVVSSSGTIFVPYTGDVVVSGLTPDGARRRVQDRLSPIAPDAQVLLMAEPGVENSVSVVGGVTNPGAYPLPNRNTTILNVIALAGGIDDTLRNPVVSLIRSGATYSIPASDLFESPEKNTRLYGDDKIIVQTDERAFTALGASGTENLIYFPKEYVTALEAVSLMGGIQDNRADPKGILVLREYPVRAVSLDENFGPRKNQVIFSLDLTSADGLFAARNFLINPNDTVLATESPIVTVRTILGLFGSALSITSQTVDTANTLGQ